MKKFFKRGITSKTRDQIDGLLFVAVPIIGLTLFIGIPLVFSLVLSFGKLTTFELTDISKGKLDGSIPILIPLNKAPKHRPVIKSLKDWIKELTGDKK